MGYSDNHKMETNKMKELSASKAAKVVGMSERTIKRWCNSDKLKFTRVGFRKEIRIKTADLIELAVTHGYVINEEELKG